MAGRKGEGGSAGAGARAKHPNRHGKEPAPPKGAVRGRPPRLAHLVSDSDRSRRRARGAISDETLVPGRVQPGTGMSDLAGGGAGENRGEILCLPNPEWLPHLLTVTGPPEPLMAFRKAASGPGTIAWQRDYARLEEDWVYTLLAPAPAERGISVHGARIVASQMRALIERSWKYARPIAPETKTARWISTRSSRYRTNCSGSDRRIRPCSPGYERTGARPGCCAMSRWRRSAARGLSQPRVMMVSATGSGPPTGRPGERWPRCGPDGRPWRCTSKSSASPSSGGLIRIFRQGAGWLVATERPDTCASLSQRRGFGHPVEHHTHG